MNELKTIKPEDFKLVTPNTKIILKMYDIFNDIFEKKCTITKLPFVDGYTLPSGGWGLYGDENKGDKPCWKITTREFKKQKQYKHSLNRIHSFTIGW